MFPDFSPKRGNRLLYYALVIHMVVLKGTNSSDAIKKNYFSEALGVYDAMSKVVAATDDAFPLNDTEISKNLGHHSPLLLLQQIIIGKEESVQNNWSSRELLQGHLSESPAPNDFQNIDALYDQNSHLMDGIQTISELLHYTFSKNAPKTLTDEYNNITKSIDTTPKEVDLSAFDTEIKDAIFNHIEPEVKELLPLDDYEVVEALKTSLVDIPSEAYYNKLLRMALRKGKKKRFGILLHYWGAINDTTIESVSNEKLPMAPTPIVANSQGPLVSEITHPEPALFPMEYNETNVLDQFENKLLSSNHSDSLKSRSNPQDIITDYNNGSVETQRGCRGGYCATQDPKYGMQERKLAFREPGSLWERLLNTRHKEENKRETGFRRQKREKREIFGEEDTSDIIDVYEALKHAVQNGVEAIMSGSAEIDPKVKSKRRDRKVKYSSEAETENESIDTPRIRRKRSHISNTNA